MKLFEATIKPMYIGRVYLAYLPITKNGHKELVVFKFDGYNKDHTRIDITIINDYSYPNDVGAVSLLHSQAYRTTYFIFQVTYWTVYELNKDESLLELAKMI